MALLKGKRALVVGVANKRSIAWGIAQSLYKQGAQLAFMSLQTNMRRVRKLAAQVDSDVVIPCDVRDDASIDAAFDQFAQAFDDKLDVLIHSIAYADIDDLGGEFINVSRSGWQVALDVSTYSLVALCRKARPLMQKAGGGSVITLTFAGGDKVVPGYNVMGVAKAALDMAVRYLAYDLGPDKIRVNAISPAAIKTLSSMVIENFDHALKLVREASPLLTNISQEDVGNAAVFLASHLSDKITGFIVKLDGGMNIMCPPAEPHRCLKKGMTS